MDTPMLDKMMAANDKSQAIGEFLDWLMEKISFAVPHVHNDDCFFTEEELKKQGLPAKHVLGFDMAKRCDHREGELQYKSIGTIEQILADYFEIDLQQVAKEQELLLTEIRKAI
jgi:hypothetical protein